MSSALLPDLAQARDEFLVTGDERLLPIVDAHHHFWDLRNPHPWLTELPAQERVVLEFRYGFRGPQASCETLAERLGISESTVRRIEKRGLSRARRLLAAS